MHHSSPLQAGLLVLAIAIVLMVKWAVLLLVTNVRNNRRFWPFLILLSILKFIFCRFWNWSNMVKEAESLRAAEWDLRRYSRPPHYGEWGYWAWLWGTAVKCQRYYESSFITAVEVIKPESLLVRPAESLLLCPQGVLDREMGAFFREFYGRIPLCYIIQASAMLLFILLVLSLLLFCNSLKLPLFWGDIRPEHQLTGRTPHPYGQYPLSASCIV